MFLTLESKVHKMKKSLFLQKDNGESGGYFHKKSFFYFSQILAFLSFWASYLRFWLIWCHALPKNNTSVVPRWFFDIWVPKLWPQKIKLFGPKTAKFGQRNSIFAKYCPLWPIWCHAWQKMQKKCLGGFLICGYQSFHSLPKSLGFLAPNRPNLAQNMHFWRNICVSGPFGPMLDQKLQVRSLGGFLLFWYQKFSSHPQKIGFLAQIRQNLCPYIGFSSPFVALLVGGCGARAALSTECVPTL